MIETKLFKRSFFLGKLVWVKGGEESGKIEIVFDILSSCEVKRSEVLMLDPNQFIELMHRGLTRETAAQYEVFLVRGFEQLSQKQSARFLKSIETFRELQMGFGIRVILLSDLEVTPELLEFAPFKPVIVRVSRTQPDPGDLNDRVHALIERAMGITRVPVKRISEKAAAFLEHHFADERDEDVLELLVIGLQRSDGEVLRFRDFLPHYPSTSGPESDLESCRN